MRTSRLAKLEYIRKWKSRPCVDCGESYHFSQMSVDHVDPSTKRYAPNQMHKSASWDAIKAELELCVPRCHNCHALRTWKEKHHLLPGQSASTLEDDRDAEANQ